MNIRQRHRQVDWGQGVVTASPCRVPLSHDSRWKHDIHTVPAARLEILSKLNFASCVILRSRLLLGVYHRYRYIYIGRRLRLELQPCSSYQGRQGDVNQSVRGCYFLCDLHRLLKGPYIAQQCRVAFSTGIVAMYSSVKDRNSQMQSAHCDLKIVWSITYSLCADVQ